MSDDDQGTHGGDGTADDQGATGGDDTGTDADDQGTDGSDDQGDGDQGDDKPLGPAGQKALDAIKAKHKKEVQRRRQLEAELARSKTGDEAEQARQEAEQAALAKANTRILKAEVRAAAAGKLADPADALQLLDLTQFEVDADGEVDADEIASAIEDLIKSKPYLAATAPTTRRFQGSGDGGVRGRTKGIDRQIADAEGKGDWKTARRLKLAKMTADSKQ